MLSIISAPSPSSIAHSSQVHALYDRNRYITLILIVLFLAENILMAVTLIRVVPGVQFDAACTVIQSPPSLLFFAYGDVSFPNLLCHCSHCYSISYSVAFVSFETILFVLTLIKFLLALRDGWGRTSVIYLLVRDGTWAFMLVFGLNPSLLSHSHFSHFSLYPVTLCVNAGFYLGAGDSSIAAIAFPWLLSIESFAGARIVLNLHAVSFDISSDGFGTSGLGGTLSSHIVFTTHSSVENRPRTPSVRWDWGGLQKYSNDDHIGRANGSRSGTGTGTASESYEMTWTASASGPSSRKRSHKGSTTATNPTSPDTCLGTCVDTNEQDVV